MRCIKILDQNCSVHYVHITMPTRQNLVHIVSHQNACSAEWLDTLCSHQNACSEELLSTLISSQWSIKLNNYGVDHVPKVVIGEFPTRSQIIVKANSREKLLYCNQKAQVCCQQTTFNGTLACESYVKGNSTQQTIYTQFCT